MPMLILTVVFQHVIGNARNHNRTLCTIIVTEIACTIWSEQFLGSLLTHLPGFNLILAQESYNTDSYYKLLSDLFAICHWTCIAYYNCTDYNLMSEQSRRIWILNYSKPLPLTTPVILYVFMTTLQITL